MMPVAFSRMVWRVLRCPSKQGISNLYCSCAFSACWVGIVSTQYFILFKCLSRLFGFMSHGFIAKGMNWQRILLGSSYHGQLFLHYWQTSFDTCLLVFVGGVVAESE